MESLNGIAIKYGKRVDNWMRLKSTLALLSQHPEEIKTVEGKSGGTFATSFIAEEFERWCQKSLSTVPCRVYFIRAAGMQMFKVGISSNPRKRLKEMQTGSPAKLVLSRDVACSNTAIAEKNLHEVFTDYRAHGEWFRYPIDKALLVFDSHFSEGV